MSNLLNCPRCYPIYTYGDGSLFVCPEYAYEWALELETENSEGQKIIKGAKNVLNDGDAVTVIKDLKVKGNPSIFCVKVISNCNIN